MNLNVKQIVWGVSLAFGVSTQAFALTAAGEDVDNMATLSYSNGSSTFNIESSPSGNSVANEDGGSGTSTSFKVDRRLDIEVAANANPVVNVTAGADDNLLEFTVTNEGNDNHGVFFTVVADPSNFTEASGTEPNDGDNADLTNVEVCIDTNQNDAVDGSECTGTTTGTLSSLNFTTAADVGAVPATI